MERTLNCNNRAERISAEDESSALHVTVMLKSKGSEKEMDRKLQQIASGAPPLSNSEFLEEFGADPQAVSKVSQFALRHHLRIEKLNLDSGQMRLLGSAGDFSAAFHLNLQFSEGRNGKQPSLRDRLALPAGLQGYIEGVFGLDKSPAARSFYLDAGGKQGVDAAGRAAIVRSYLPSQIADAYEFPKESLGAGQNVAIIELGGGIRLNDNAKYYREHGLKVPAINVIEVDDGQNAPWDPSGANEEVSLDSQIVGAVAPEASQSLIFAPNSNQGFLDGVLRAIFPEGAEKQSTVISISWGKPLEKWRSTVPHPSAAPDQAGPELPEAIRNLNLAFKKAALKGISVFAASGDSGAGDGLPDGRYETDYPASDPYVTACGGTQIELDGSAKLTRETAWNRNNGVAGGGGICEYFPVPDYQSEIALPPNANGNGIQGRGVPDMSGNASANSGYLVRVNGQEKVLGGTSAVAPLYAALTLRTNGALGRSVGFLNPFLYKQATASGIFNDVISGNNGGYDAAPGWDAATGFGSINGTRFLEACRLRAGD